MKRTTGFYQDVKEHLIKLQRFVTYVFNKGFFFFYRQQCYADTNVIRAILHNSTPFLSHSTT